MEQRTFPKCSHALLSRTSNEVQTKLSVACNDGFGADHLRQTKLPYVPKSCRTLATPQCNKISLQTATDGSLMSCPAYESHAMIDSHGKHPANVVMSDGTKCPPPVFTNTQKLNLIKAWRQIHLYIDEVNN